MADAKQGMIPGFNHNVKHCGKVFHVQTEDSGISNPQIVTHLFAGGNILASKKIFYGDIAEAENLIAIVRDLMESSTRTCSAACSTGSMAKAQTLAPGKSTSRRARAARAAARSAGLSFRRPGLSAGLSAARSSPPASAARPRRRRPPAGRPSAAPSVRLASVRLASVRCFSIRLPSRRRGGAGRAAG
jgi:hypothetical protein